MQPSYHDLSRLSTLVKVGLGATMLVAVVSLWSGSLQVGLVQRVIAGAAVSEAEIAGNDGRQGLLGIIQTVVYLGTMILFLRWVYVANRNARAMGAQGMEFAPGWAVGYYFIPILNLWRPFQAMKETFKASHPDHTLHWRSAPHPGIVPLWWTFWLIAGVAGQAALRTSLAANTPETLLVASNIGIVADLIDIPLGLVVIVMVSKLESWQSEKRLRPETSPVFPEGTIPGYVSSA
jgi:hypothetical protein